MCAHACVCNVCMCVCVYVCEVCMWAMRATLYTCMCVCVCVVSEPDPRKFEKEGLVNRAEWKCTLRTVRNFINCGTFHSQ